jgi:hypothetical protein
MGHGGAAPSAEPSEVVPFTPHEPNGAAVHGARGPLHIERVCDAPLHRDVGVPLLLVWHASPGLLLAVQLLLVWHIRSGLLLGVRHQDLVAFQGP